MGFSINPIDIVKDTVKTAGEVVDSSADAFGDALDAAKTAAAGMSIADIGHLALDGVGMVPVVGEAADLANGAWYAAEGDWTNAALSAGAAIPFAGNLATGAKWVKHGVEAADTISGVAKTADTAKDVAKVVTTPEGGRITYGALDDLGRPTGVTSRIIPDMIGTGTKADSSIIPPGWSGNGALHNESRGHLLGRQLGGSGDMPENLVTLEQNPANSPVMSGFETEVRNVVEGGEPVEYSAIPDYDGSNLVPRGVTLSGQGGSGFQLDVTILNPPGM